MTTSSNLLKAFSLIALSTGTLQGASASARTLEERSRAGQDVILELNNNQPQPILETMREEFPFLASALEAYALGDVWSRPEIDHRTRQLAAVAAFAATGELGMLRVHAGYALNIGVTEEELKEILYMVTVPAGFPKTITASQVLLEVIQQHRLRSEADKTDG
jgi:4-carboxymuconolactone decarboxylase